MALPKVVFHRDGWVSANGVRVGMVSGSAHKWMFRPTACDDTSVPCRLEGPFRNRAAIRVRVRAVYQIMESARAR